MNSELYAELLVLLSIRESYKEQWGHRKELLLCNSSRGTLKRVVELIVFALGLER